MRSGSISCINKHYVCDSCHGKDAFDAVRYFMLHTTSDNPAAISEQMMSHPSVPMIGGEHHAIVATSVMAALKNFAKQNGPVSYNGVELFLNDELLERALDRTWTDRLPSCMCANHGACGAGLGAGAVFSLLTEATCDTPKLKERQLSMRVANSALERIASYLGTCCKLSTRLSVESVCQALGDYLGVALPTNKVKCAHKTRNPYKCLGDKCPYN